MPGTESPVTFCSHSPWARRSSSCCWQSGRHSLHFLKIHPGTILMDGRRCLWRNLDPLARNNHAKSWYCGGGDCDRMITGVSLVAKPEQGMQSSSEGAISLCIIFSLQCWLISHHTNPPLQHHAERGGTPSSATSTLQMIPGHCSYLVHSLMTHPTPSG